MVKFAAPVDKSSSHHDWTRLVLATTGALAISSPPHYPRLFLPGDAYWFLIYYSSLNGWVFVDLLLARHSCWGLGWRHCLAFPPLQFPVPPAGATPLCRHSPDCFPHCICLILPPRPRHSLRWQSSLHSFLLSNPFKFSHKGFLLYSSPLDFS